HASLRDWAQFAALHAHRGATMTEGPLDGMLREESFRSLHAPGPFNDYAAGWIVTERPWAGAIDPETEKRRTGLALTHSGSNTMWFCTLWVAPERKLALLAVCNQGSDGAQVACDQVVGALLKSLDEAAPK
ncbi:MAG: hypothetical protein AAF368_15935, partial [Planctomycetota bacterium]